MAKISLIMPVYKAEYCLKKAVDSVLSQTFTDWELYLIEDCSPDGSLAICEELAKSDERIKLIAQKENKGPGPARNEALKHISGEYVMFMDCDDWVEPDMLECFYAKAKESGDDIVVAGFYQDFLDENDEFAYTVEVAPPVFACKDKKESAASVALMDEAKVFSFSVNKIYKASVIKENNVIFPPMMHSEDYFFAIELFKYVNSVSSFDGKFYHYNKPQRTTLTSRSYIEGFTELILKRFAAERQLLTDAGVYEGETRALACAVHIKHIFSALENNCAKESGLSSKERKAELKKLLSHEFTAEAATYAAENSKAGKIMKKLLATKSAFLVGLFAKTLNFMKKRMSGVFNKLKTK